MKKLLIVMTLLILVGTAGYAFSGRKGVPVDVVEVKRATIREYIEERAKTRLRDTYEITMPLNGRILPITLREGDLVRKDQVVAEMDTEELDETLTRISKQVDVSQRQVDNHELTILQSKETIRASKARYDYAISQYDRATQLAQQNAIAESEIERNMLSKVENEVKYNYDLLEDRKLVTEKGNAELRHEELLSRQREATSDRKKAVILSSVDGIVLSRQSANERWLPAGTPLLEIGSLDQLEVEVEVLTQEAVRIQEGDPVEIEGAAIGQQPVMGQVSRVYPRGFTKRSSLGVEQQRVIVLIDFNQGVLEQLMASGKSLGADFRVATRIFTDEHADAIVVPRSSIFRNAQGGWQAFVVRDQVTTLVDVEVGLRNDFEVEIVKGVRPGELVILAPDSDLGAGTLVEPNRVRP